MAWFAGALAASTAFVGGAYYLDRVGRSEKYQQKHTGHKLSDEEYRLHWKEYQEQRRREEEEKMKPPTNKRGMVLPIGEERWNKRQKMEQFEETDYTETVHHSRTKYGRPMRRNLRNAWKQLNADMKHIYCRYQSIATNGFRDGLGTFRLTYDTFLPNAAISPNVAAAPLWAFELNCLPTGFMQTQDGGGNNVLRVTPRVGSRLVLDGTGYGTWTHDQVDLFERNLSGTVPQPNSYDIVEQDVRPMHHHYQHNWSDIKLTLYPQKGLPGKIMVSLVKFDPDLYTWPPARGNSFTTEGVAAAYSHYFYDATGDSATEIEDNRVTWNEYLHGKALHPNFRRERVNGVNRRPFTVLRQEVIDMPARDGPSNGTYRVLKNLFFRNDRVYNVSNTEDVPVSNPILTGWDPGNRQYVGSASVWTKNEDRIFLLVEGVPYAAQTTSPVTSVTDTMMSFDIVIRNKFTIRDSDTAVVVENSNQPPTNDIIGPPAEELATISEEPTTELVAEG